MKAMYIIPPVSMSVLFMTLYSFFGNIEMYFEKTKIIMFASCIVALLNIVLNYIFIPIFGFVAAGYTTLFCYICYSIVHYLLMINVCKKNAMKNPFNSLIIWGIAIFYVAVSVLVTLIYKYYLLRYIIIIILTCCICLFLNKNKKVILGK